MLVYKTLDKGFDVRVCKVYTYISCWSHLCLL